MVGSVCCLVSLVFVFAGYFVVDCGWVVVRICAVVLRLRCLVGLVWCLCE